MFAFSKASTKIAVKSVSIRYRPIRMMTTKKRPVHMHTLNHPIWLSIHSSFFLSFFQSHTERWPCVANGTSAYFRGINRWKHDLVPSCPRWDCVHCCHRASNPVKVAVRIQPCTLLSCGRIRPLHIHRGLQTTYLYLWYSSMQHGYCTLSRNTCTCDP